MCHFIFPFYLFSWWYKISTWNWIIWVVYIVPQLSVHFLLILVHLYIHSYLIYKSKQLPLSFLAPFYMQIPDWTSGFEAHNNTQK
jgi:hypothetical protein